MELDQFSCDEAAIGYSTVDGPRCMRLRRTARSTAALWARGTGGEDPSGVCARRENSAPVVGLFDSDGAKLGEGARCDGCTRKSC